MGLRYWETDIQRDGAGIASELLEACNRTSRPAALGRVAEITSISYFLGVSGDLKLFAEDDVMPFNTGKGIVGHYTFAKISLDGFALDPKLGLAA
jgi:hypothetical protein